MSTRYWSQTMRIPVALAAALFVAGCNSGTSPPRNVATAPSSAVPASTASVQCVELNRIREAKVVDDRTIDFIMVGGETLRNTLPNSCSGLGAERAFSYSTSISRLCSVDIITVIQQGGGIRTGASCGLGKFVPYAPVPPAR